MDVVANLVRMERGGRDLDIRPPGAAHELLHDELGHRRPADVAMAEEEYSIHFASDGIGFRS